MLFLLFNWFDQRFYESSQYYYRNCGFKVLEERFPCEGYLVDLSYFFLSIVCVDPVM